MDIPLIYSVPRTGGSDLERMIRLSLSLKNARGAIRGRGYASVDVEVILRPDNSYRVQFSGNPEELSDALPRFFHYAGLPSHAGGVHGSKDCMDVLGPILTGNGKRLGHYRFGLRGRRVEDL